MYRYLIEDGSESVVLVRPMLLPGFDGKELDKESYQIIAQEIGWTYEKVASSTVELLYNDGEQSERGLLSKKFCKECNKPLPQDRERYCIPCCERIVALG